LITEIAALGLSRAEKVFVGVQPGLVGLRGVDGVLPPLHQRDHEVGSAFEQL
jgi:hypothetical protein